MKVGDMVIRAYATVHGTSPGIIIDQHLIPVEFDGDNEGTYTYDQVDYVVFWSDYTTSTEMLEELMYFEDTFHETR